MKCVRICASINSFANRKKLEGSIGFLLVSSCIVQWTPYTVATSAETESHLNGLTSGASPVVVRSTLDQVTERSQQLQKELADSAHILSKYNLKSAQGVSAGAQDCGAVSCAL